MKLSDLIRKGVSGAVATATVATPATQRGSKAPTVANVATVAVANPPDRVMGGNPTVATVATVAVANPPQGGVAANDPTAAPASHWLIHFADRDPLESWFSPAVTHGEVLAAHPAALAAEPIPERDIRKPTTSTMTTASCKTCRHRKRPGLSAGYCGGGRDDLPGAYGLHHPLRKLPADEGESCASYLPHEG